MISAQDKIKANVRIFWFGLIGLLLMLLLIIGTWCVVQVIQYQIIFWKINTIIGFSCALAFLIGFLIRGLEKRSIGIDIEEMDPAEIDVLISILQKQKGGKK
jgi:hypothetical protein